ncbi:MAG TPA: serine--tRNA ligase [Chthoniobacterales bacterium]|jgi:seryl-tRNA synthetase|nr:serine--tRNA ligase [Chthoniobacterales bacterium]
MLDIRLLREKPDFVRERLATRSEDLSAQVDEVLAIDTQRRRAETELQKLNAERNRLSKEIGILRSHNEPSADLETRVRAIAEEITQQNAVVTGADEKQRNLLLNLPNLPHLQAPIGKGADDNPLVREWGEKPSLGFTPLGHVELATALKLIDFERAAKISGSGFVCFTNLGARLQRGLLQFLLDLHTTEHGYIEVSPPYLVRREAMIGTTQLPKFEHEMCYGLEEDQLFLIPTAEVPVTNLHREETLTLAELPKKYVAYTPCFRREAGAAGKDTRGLIRIHQFDKVELVKIATPETSYSELETLTVNAEKVLQILGLHYRIIELCTGDLGFGAAKTYDIEVWAPGQGRYLEVSSCTNFEDFQARRMNLKYKDAGGKNRLCHTLNGSGTALPRLLVALIETYQQSDGSIRLPEPLPDYVRLKEIR